MIRRPPRSTDCLASAASDVYERLVVNEDIAELKQLIEKHHRYTGSELARRLLGNWPATLTKFVKVMPLDYKRVLEENQKTQTMVAIGA